MTELAVVSCRIGRVRPVDAGSESKNDTPSSTGPNVRRRRRRGRGDEWSTGVSVPVSVPVSAPASGAGVVGVGVGVTGEVTGEVTKEVTGEVTGEVKMDRMRISFDEAVG